MNDIFPFINMIGILIFQRMGELLIARKNEKWMKLQGAIEFGEKQYRSIVLIHVLFFISLIIEKIMFNKELSPFWPVILMIIIIVQFLRIWVIFTLGKYWNTKIIVQPYAKVIQNGPYKYMKHPNYLVVITEIMMIPILFQCIWTSLIFTIINLYLLSIRIQEEEKALNSLTEYKKAFQDCNRFIPKIVK
ncbi:isoprenylcysteine carboxyl methyltransferase family protein [Neobacillus thermocopriae]|uniref:Isoprenylcysteine carboxyl methyltransferase n=1 Tax=Neobacillus thermocopriae TaxID=1215031 RepID=A0A6B3TQ99_9BACI|nr:isoprenylcysteine carboxylmethyltransferase family protein [Neobacillus thermocopriae]MED3625050.1 isoprenylcysteine carboxylmethyltransferase family protein [Neobacillus thermocopriae]MED3712752.1 isoprenylcysteine carboxylmethyltransferase family protein [Neobacillus thermocopriae]NEX78993.1 hypothetical protein [Neobacillus thermocopriae]